MNSWVVVILVCLCLITLDNNIHSSKIIPYAPEQPTIISTEADSDSIKIPDRFLIKRPVVDPYIKHMKDTMKGEIL